MLGPGAADPNGTPALLLVRNVFSRLRQGGRTRGEADEGAFTVDEFDRMAEEGVENPETLSLLFDKRPAARYSCTSSPPTNSTPE